MTLSRLFLKVFFLERVNFEVSRRQVIIKSMKGPVCSELNIEFKIEFLLELSENLTKALPQPFSCCKAKCAQKSQSTSIKGNNSAANEQNITDPIANLDRDDINAYTKFDEILSICS